MPGYVRHPAPRQQLKADCRRRAFDDFDRPTAKCGERVEQRVAGIGAVSKEMAQPWKQVMHGFNNQPGTIAILDVGGMDDGPDKKARGIGHDMALAPVDLFGGIVTAWTAALGGLD